jgi:hypothetical protein
MKSDFFLIPRLYFLILVFSGISHLGVKKNVPFHDVSMQ